MKEKDHEQELTAKANHLVMRMLDAGVDGLVSKIQIGLTIWACTAFGLLYLDPWLKKRRRERQKKREEAHARKGRP